MSVNHSANSSHISKFLRAAAIFVLRCVIVRADWQVPDACNSSLRNFSSKAFNEKSTRPAPECPAQAVLYLFNQSLCRNDRDDFQGHRIDDQNVVADQDVIEPAVFRYDGHDVLGERRNVNIRGTLAPTVMSKCSPPLKCGACSLPMTA